jgi:hypothetical protein
MTRTTLTVAAVTVICLGSTAQAVNLTAYYNFEGNYNDYPGAGVNADDLTTQQVGASLVADAPANALGSTMSYAFDARASDSRVWTSAWSPDLTSTDQYTMMFWIKADDDFQQMDNTRLATVKFDAANVATAEIGWQIEGFGQSNNGNGPDLRIQGAPVGNFFAPPANGALDNDGATTPEDWHHVAFVVSNTGSTANNRAYMQTFLDGNPLSQAENVAATGGTDLRNLTGRLILGGHNQSNRSATGQLDDFALFDDVLSNADILAIARGELSIVRGITVCGWGLRCNSTWAVVHHI